MFFGTGKPIGDVAQPLPGEEIPCAADGVLVFIDDTGHETFAGNQPWYGLGGCVVPGLHYPRLKGLWEEVRRRINGSPDAPLHAADMPRSAEAYAALSQFFLDPSFFRLAVVLKKGIMIPEGMHSMVPVMGALQEDVAILASYVSCSSVSLIVESSDRADPLLKTKFGELKPESYDVAIPVRHYIMPKRSREPGLEIADFVISAAGSQIQRHIRGNQGLSPDFRDVFCRLPAAGCLFSVIAGVANEPGSDMVQILRFGLPEDVLSVDVR